MRQFTLFAEIQPIRVWNLDEQQSLCLEEIAERAAEHPLLIGEVQRGLPLNSPSRRLEFMNQYLKNEPGFSHDKYPIFFDEKIIGYLAIWDGWVTSEMEYGLPCIELAFIDPKYQKEFDVDKIREYLNTFVIERYKKQDY